MIPESEAARAGSPIAQQCLRHQPTEKPELVQEMPWQANAGMYYKKRKKGGKLTLYELSDHHTATPQFPAFVHGTMSIDSQLATAVGVW